MSGATGRGRSKDGQQQRAGGGTASDGGSDAGRSSARARGYTTRWDKARAGYLAKHPFCKMCEDRGVLSKAEVVDHIQPHKGDDKLFWDSKNWQPLCAPCHNSAKQRIEKRGFDHQVGADGFPVDPKHPANLIE